MISQSQPKRRGLLTLFSLVLLGSGVATAQNIVLTGCHVENGQEVCLLAGVKTTYMRTDAPTSTPTSPSSVVAVTTRTGTTSAQTTAITGCHQHGTTHKGNGKEVQVLATATGSEALPTAYTRCHAHGATELYCMKPDGGEVQVLESAEDEGTSTVDETGDAASGAEENCHFHAGVEHCVGAGESETEVDPKQCERKDRDYNYRIRIGLLFAILATSYGACLAPLLITKVLKVKLDGTFFTIVKQFGTGVIISTALVHLTTHSQLMFANTCLGSLKYEGTTTAIIMAGAFVAFLVDFLGHRLGVWRRQVVNEQEAALSVNSTDSPASEVAAKRVTAPELQTLAALSHHHDFSQAIPNDVLSVAILEAGILFHSILIGITLVVAGDSVFITLFIVILFHQIFEGLALGARIAAIEKLTKLQFILMPLAFGLITPLGMAIGIAVLDTFNGNDPSTIIAIGTLDALSAGILLWVGLVSMLAHDWLFGELRHAGLVKTSAGLFSLVSGMIVMSVLGKWA